ncbi:MAG: helix-turn-helix domain-containing protein [Acidimicrobiia bacterium]
MSVETTLDAEGDDELEATIARLANRGERLVFSIPEAALLLGISRALAYELARRGEVPTMQLGRRRVVPRAALARFVAAATAGPNGRGRVMTTTRRSHAEP